jgi:hypothetical protein
MVSIKFAELESSLQFMFGTIFGLDMEATFTIASKIGNEACLDLMERRLPSNHWREEVDGHALHFIVGFRKCLDNRNHLVHSNLAWTGNEHTVLFKTSKQGKTLGAVPTLAELRQVADDMHAYTEYGRWLGNHINNAFRARCRWSRSLPFHCPINRLRHMACAIRQTPKPSDKFFKAVATCQVHFARHFDFRRPVGRHPTYRHCGVNSINGIIILTNGQ